MKKTSPVAGTGASSSAWPSSSSSDNFAWPGTRNSSPSGSTELTKDNVKQLNKTHRVHDEVDKAAELSGLNSFWET